MIEVTEETVQQAMQDVVRHRERIWKDEWEKENHPCFAPTPPDLAPKAWFIKRWDTGYFVMDLEEMVKLPKAAQNKIEKLGERRR